MEPRAYRFFGRRIRLSETHTEEVSHTHRVAGTVGISFSLEGIMQGGIDVMHGMYMGNFDGLCVDNSSHSYYYTVHILTVTAV